MEEEMDGVSIDMMSMCSSSPLQKHLELNASTCSKLSKLTVVR